MISFGYFLLFTLIYAQSFIDHEQIYLSREKFNSTSMRVWLHLKSNSSSNFSSYYVFTLRIIDEHNSQLKDRYEKPIGDYAKIDLNEQENHTIDIHHLSSGRYEICINFFPKRSSRFYSRSSNSCLPIAWNVPEHEKEQPNLFIHILFMILIIILLVACAFFIYAVHTYIHSRKGIRLPQADEEVDRDINACVRFLVNQHFVDDINPFAVSIRQRVHQRYGHRLE